MKRFFNIKWALMALTTALLIVSCGQSATQPTAGSAVQGAPTKMEFIAIGQPGAGFPDAKDKAYTALLEVAIKYLIGDSSFSAKRSQLSTLLSYVGGYKYVIEKTWPNRQTEADGSMTLTIKALVDLEKLTKQLNDMGISVGTVADTTVATTTPADTSSEPSWSAETTTAGSESDTDLSNVDISDMSFLVYYKADDPRYDDPEEREFATWAINAINSELGANGIMTFDPDAVATLIAERNLLHEDAAGSIGIGLLIAEKVQAEIYAEVTPTVSYKGSMNDWTGQMMLDVKVYVRTTGNLIANIAKGGRSSVGNNKSGAIKASLRGAVEKIMAELIPSLKTYVNNGRVYFVRLEGVSDYRDASVFSTTLKQMDGIVNVTLKTLSQQDMVADYSVRYKGNPTDLLDSMFMFLMDRPGFEYFNVRSVRGSELIFTMD